VVEGVGGGPQRPLRRVLRSRLRRLRRPRTRPRTRGPSFNQLIPNILTMLGLCCGLTAVRFGFEGRWEHAAVLIVVAAAIDGIDGRLARLLKGTSRFGAEFDSLSDFLCFGVAPALVLYLWTMHDGPRGLGFAPCLLFAVCSALRLARLSAFCRMPLASRAALTSNSAMSLFERRRTTATAVAIQNRGACGSHDFSRSGRDQHRS